MIVCWFTSKPHRLRTASTLSRTQALARPTGFCAASATALGEGSAVFVQQGATGAGETYVCNTTGTITFGTTNITFAQISSAQIYSAGTGLTLSGTQFSITNVGTAGTYGSASSVPVLAINAQGQVTSATPTAIAIAAAAVSGLAASATTNTTDASNITSGTLPSARLNGSYTGITGVGTLTAGTWNASTIAATRGGTGLTSFVQGDLLYATSSTTIGSLADVVAGNALISGGVGGDPAWGKVGLATHVSGTLPVGNGGTGATTLTGYVIGNGTGAFTASASIPNSATTATSANTASAIVARDGSGNFSAGTITASLNGNASTATTAANVNNGTLSMAVSGTGLSGSATFTANQSGNSTFTVTSNATNANTAGAIVARDGSGNFSAGTITASLSGNATTSSSTTGNAATATALQTARNIGGVSFNGTADINLPGVNTAGNQNTSGNAATASSSPLLSALGNYVWSQSTLPVSYNAGIQSAFVGPSGGEGLWQNYGSVMTMRTYSGGGGSLQMYVPYSPNFGGTGLQVRFGNYDVSNGNSWTSWKTLLASDNFNSYAPTLTGGGASGTWSINVTGSAGSATTATTATNWGSYGGVPGAGTSFGNANTIGRSDANGYTYFFYINSNTSNSENPGVSQVIVTNGGDNFYRKASIAHLTSSLSGTAPINISGSATQLNGFAASTYIGKFGSGSGYYQADNWLQFNTAAGLYWPATNAAEWNANTSSSYGNLRMVGSRNSYDGIYSTFSAVNGIMFDSGGNGGAYREANGRWYWYHNLSTNCMGVGTSSTSSSYGIYVIKGVYSEGTVVAAGNITANSDERLKKDWTPVAADFVERLAQTKGGTYTRIDSGERQAGSSAQDWQKLLPEVVHEETDEAKTLSLAYGNAALVSAIELAKRVVDQEARIAKLEALVAQLTKGNAP